MNALLKNIYETKEFLNSKNEKVRIHSETSIKQCEFLQQVISDHKFTRSLEIGIAYGMSSLSITEAIAKNHGRHYAIDKFQYSDWGGNGLDLIKQAGYEGSLDFCEKYCYEALSELIAAGRTFDFAYVDTTKLFDWILVDFFLIDKLLEVNGIIIFDDVHMPSIKKVIRYVSQFPHYEVYKAFPKNEPLPGNKRMASILKHVPLSKHLIKDEIVKSDFDLGIHADCIALQKVDIDKRHWSWHVAF